MSEKSECPYCGNEYVDLKQHIEKKHPDERWPPKTFSNRQPCQVCGSKQTRVFYREEEDDLWLCEKCAENKDFSEEMT